MHSVVVFFTLLAASVWVGGFVTIMVAAGIPRDDMTMIVREASEEAQHPPLGLGPPRG